MLKFPQKANSSAQRIDNFVIIGTETTLNSNVPVYPYYGYSISQTLYLQTELNFSNKMIEGIGYQYNGNQSVLELWIEIYFEHTTLDNLTNTVSLNNATKVFDDVYYFKEGEEWSTVDIEPFYYNNNDNLLVTVIEKSLDGTHTAINSILPPCLYHTVGVKAHKMTARPIILKIYPCLTK